MSTSQLITPDKVLRTVRKLASKGKTTSCDVWIARLEAELRYAPREEAEQAWVDARGSVMGDRVEEVWLWGVEIAADKDRILEASDPHPYELGADIDATNRTC